MNICLQGFVWFLFLSLGEDLLVTCWLSLTLEGRAKVLSRKAAPTAVYEGSSVSTSFFLILFYF